MIVAVAGKGGTGKTTISALLLKIMLDRGVKPVLCVDADPSVGLPHALGLDTRYGMSVGGIREQTLKNLSNIPKNMSKKEYIDLKITESIIELEEFDLLVMGRPEGAGCYCYVNSILRDSLKNLGDQYNAVIVDCEAGLEHFSRRTAGAANLILVVSDPTPRGLATAISVNNLADELFTHGIKKIFVYNKLSGKNQKVSLELFLNSAVKGIFDNEILVPLDPEILTFEQQGKSLLEIDDYSVAYRILKHSLGLLFENK